jgi:DNA-binding response OmpR family regulator
MIEDDTALSAMVAEYLGKAGFQVNACADGESGMQRLGEEEFQAVKQTV